MKRLVLLSLCFILVFSSCDEFSLDPKHQLAVQISSESCQVISEIGSSMGLGIAGELLGNSLEVESNSNIVPDTWCECFTNYIAQDMVSILTYEQMEEIANDQVKLAMYLSKAIPKRQVEIQQCISGNVQEGLKEYSEFEQELNQKFE